MAWAWKRERLAVLGSRFYPREPVLRVLRGLFSPDFLARDSFKT